MDKPNLLKPIGAVVLVIVIAIIIIAIPKKTAAPIYSGTVATTSVPAVTKETDGTLGTQTATTTVKSKSTSPYKDGSYSASGSYMSPGGLDNVDVTATLKNGIVTDVEVVGRPGDPTSQRYQDKFIANYKVLVIGKGIDSVHLDKVSGSSLTSGGFNAAIEKIKLEAKA